MKKALWKDTFREIRQSKTRFLAILFIMMIGVSFFVGIRSAGPDMLETANDYYRTYHLADFKVQSTLGLETEDLTLLEQEADRVEPRQSLDVIEQGSGTVVRLTSHKNSDELNQYRIMSGRLPERAGEIALDDGPGLPTELEIGDTVTFETEEDKSEATTALPDDEKGLALATETFEIVGFVRSPVFIEAPDRGHSVVGSGRLGAFGVISADSFDGDIITEILLAADDLAQHDTYSTAYKKRRDEREKTLKDLLRDRANERNDQLRGDLKREIETGRDELEAGREELEAGRKELTAARSELDAGQADYQAGQAELSQKKAAGQAELNAGRTELAKQKDELDAKAAELAGGRQQLADAQAELDGEREALEQLPEAAQEQAADKLAAAQKELETRAEELARGEAELAVGYEQIEQAEAELGRGANTLQTEVDAAAAELQEAADELARGEEEYAQSLLAFEEEERQAQTEFDKAETELTEAEDLLDTLPEASYFVSDRTDNPGFAEYADNAERMNAISNVFPVFFFFIAILISLTTMTRMVDEEREYIGLMKALGYKRPEILIKFLTYATIATTVGAFAGLLIGYPLFPKLIFNAYRSLYNLPPLIIQTYPLYTILALGAAYAATVFSTLLAVSHSLRSNAATLLRPKAPKEGTRIWLEKIPFIWNHLSFNYKITFRNIFRYKMRMLMTIFGVAGSMGLILTGLGISDSIMDIPEIQFDELSRYEALVALDEDAPTAERQAFEDMLAGEKDLDGHLAIAAETTTAAKTGVNTQDVQLYGVMTPEEMEDFMPLRDVKTDELLELPESGAMVTQKLAELLEIKAGDTVTLTAADGNDEWTFDVVGVVRNYLGHYVYVSPAEFERVIGEVPKSNLELLQYDPDATDSEAIGEKLLAEPAVRGVTYLDDIHEQFTDTIDSLDIITHVLVISAALLAFTVLYNLTNINVAERIRELSTIKVLGFYDGEVTSYIYRENIFLTLMGVAVGCVFGYFLHGFLIRTTEIDVMLFSRKINGMSYLISSGLTLLFSGVVGAIVHFNLRRVDMLDALKTGD